MTSLELDSWHGIINWEPCEKEMKSASEMKAAGKRAADYFKRAAGICVCKQYGFHINRLSLLSEGEPGD